MALRLVKNQPRGGSNHTPRRTTATRRANARPTVAATHRDSVPIPMSPTTTATQRDSVPVPNSAVTTPTQRMSAPLQRSPPSVKPVRLIAKKEAMRQREISNKVCCMYTTHIKNIVQITKNMTIKKNMKKLCVHIETSKCTAHDSQRRCNQYQQP